MIVKFVLISRTKLQKIFGIRGIFAKVSYFCTKIMITLLNHITKKNK